jgi:hypothetical protein
MGNAALDHQLFAFKSPEAGGPQNSPPIFSMFWNDDGFRQSSCFKDIKHFSYIFSKNHHQAGTAVHFKQSKRP